MYDQIKAADQKAAYILTFLFVLLIWSSDMRQVFFWVNVDNGISLRWVLSLVQVIALAEALTVAMQADDKDFLIEQYLVNIASLTTMCRKKYFMVGLAFRGLIGALFCHVVALIVV